MNLKKKDNKFEIQSFKKYEDIVSSIQDEEFQQDIVHIYDDVKLKVGILLLSHGQNVSIYN